MLFDGRNRDADAKRPVAVVNLDDPQSPRVIEAARRGGLAVTGYGAAAAAEVAIRGVHPTPSGLEFDLIDSGTRHSVALGLLGRYNAWNAAAAYGAARALGLEPEVAVAGLEALAGVPGRLERVREGQEFDVVVDYAHTPDALAKALAAVREHARGRLLLVFGCGGDRDRAKRPEMGRVAATAADAAWITNDNPRGEAGEAIAREIAAGDPAARLRVELDRRAAIAGALAEAKSGDALLIAGKGHETTQTVGAQVLPFDDRAVARELLRSRAGAGR
jgi:UDP-N-acetylmuramoyl-L-alanyl-D-glutamate--2,6-diaminopimelate ligase